MTNNYFYSVLFYFKCLSFVNKSHVEAKTSLFQDFYIFRLHNLPLYHILILISHVDKVYVSVFSQKYHKDVLCTCGLRVCHFKSSHLSLSGRRLCLNCLYWSPNLIIHNILSQHYYKVKPAKLFHSARHHGATSVRCHVLASLDSPDACSQCFLWMQNNSFHNTDP